MTVTGGRCSLFLGKRQRSTAVVRTHAAVLIRVVFETEERWKINVCLKYDVEKKTTSALMSHAIRISRWKNYTRKKMITNRKLVGSKAPHPVDNGRREKRLGSCTRYGQAPKCLSLKGFRRLLLAKTFTTARRAGSPWPTNITVKHVKTLIPPWSSPGMNFA